MPLIPTTLASALEQQWLSSEGGSNPGSVDESADRFANAVSQWFAGATAGGFPCATALARKPQLAQAASAALSSPTAAVAGARIGQALALYMTGQSFGTGTSAAPLATGAVITAFAAVFADLEAAPRDRGLQLGVGCWGLALSTLVTIPPSPTPVPIT